MYKKTVINCTILKVDESQLIDVEKPWGTIKVVKGSAEFTIPKEGYKQPKRLKKKEFPNYNVHKMNKHEYWEKLVQHKLDKWERKNPRPIKDNCKEPDLFESQYIPQWEAERDIAREHFRDFVVSIYDKLPVIGRFKESENKFTEKTIISIKDINGDGHRINDVDIKTSKLLQKVQKITDETKALNAKLVSINILDHKRQKGRIILPQAA